MYFHMIEKLKNKQKKVITKTYHIILKELSTGNGFIKMIISSRKVLWGLTVVLVAIPHLGSAVFLCLKKKTKNTSIKKKVLFPEYHQHQIFSQSCNDLICLPDTSWRFLDWRTNMTVHKYTPSFPVFVVYF